MKFNKAKKEKMRKMRSKRIRQYFNREWHLHIVSGEKEITDYEVVSTKVNNDNYYYLCKDCYTGEVFIAKLVYSGWVKAFKLSPKKILKNKAFFKEWIKQVNFKERRRCLKYVLRHDGSIDVRNTYYGSNKETLKDTESEGLVKIIICGDFF